MADAKRTGVIPDIFRAINASFLADFISFTWGYLLKGLDPGLAPRGEH